MVCFYRNPTDVRIKQNDTYRVSTVLLPTRVKLLLSDGHRYLTTTTIKKRRPGKLISRLAATAPAAQERGSARVSVEVHNPIKITHESKEKNISNRELQPLPVSTSPSWPSPSSSRVKANSPASQTSSTPRDSAPSAPPTSASSSAWTRRTTSGSS